MIKREADVTGAVVDKVKKIYGHRCFALEVKMKGGKFYDHQKKALRQVEDGKFTYKIPDMGKRNPFDVIHLGDAEAIYCVVDGKNVVCEVNGGVMKHNFRI